MLYRLKRPRQRDEAHLAFIRTLPCLLTWRSPVEACHIRYGDMQWGKRPTGAGEKPSDVYVVPLHPDLHREQHDMNERLFWMKRGVDPIPLAMAFWVNSGDEATCNAIIETLVRSDEAMP